MSSPNSQPVGESLNQADAFFLDETASGLAGGTPLFALHQNAIDKSFPEDARRCFSADEIYSTRVFGLPRFLNAFASLMHERGQQHGGVIAIPNLYPGGDNFKRQGVLNMIMRDEIPKVSPGGPPCVYVLDGDAEMHMDETNRGGVRFRSLDGLVAVRNDGGHMRAFGVVFLDRSQSLQRENDSIGDEGVFFSISHQGIDIFIPVAQRIGAAVLKSTEFAEHDLVVHANFRFVRKKRQAVPELVKLQHISIASTVRSPESIVSKGRDLASLLFAKIAHSLGLEDVAPIGNAYSSKHGPDSQPSEVVMDLATLLAGGKLTAIPTMPGVPKEIIETLTRQNQKVFDSFGDKRFLHIEGAKVKLASIIQGFGAAIEGLFMWEHSDPLSVDALTIQSLGELIRQLTPSFHFSAEDPSKPSESKDGGIRRRLKTLLDQVRR